MGEEVGVPLPFGALSLQTWLMGKSKGLGDKESAALITVLEDIAGVEVKPRSE